MASGLPSKGNPNDPACVSGLPCACAMVAGKDTNMNEMELCPQRGLRLLGGVRQA